MYVDWRLHPSPDCAARAYVAAVSQGRALTARRFHRLLAEGRAAYARWCADRAAEATRAATMAVVTK